MNVDRVICRNQTAVRLENNSDDHMYYRITNKTISLHEFLDTEGYLPPQSMVLLQLVVNGQNKTSRAENQEMIYVHDSHEIDIQQAFRQHQRDIRRVVFCYSDKFLDDSDDLALKIQDSSMNERSRARLEEQAESSQSCSNVVRLSRRKQCSSKTFANSESEAINVSLPVFPRFDSLKLEQNDSRASPQISLLESPHDAARLTSLPDAGVMRDSGLRQKTSATISMFSDETAGLLERANFSDSGTMFERSNEMQAVQSVVRADVPAEDPPEPSSIVLQTVDEAEAKTARYNPENNAKPTNTVEEEAPEQSDCQLGVMISQQPSQKIINSICALEVQIENLEKEALGIQALERQLARASAQLDELAEGVQNNMRMVRHGRFEQLLTCGTLVLVVLIYRIIRH